MEQPLSPARLLRGLLICTAGVLPAVGAHVAGGGSAPSPLLLLAVVLGSTAAAASVSRHEWTTAQLVAALGTLQLLVHGLLWVGGQHSAHGGDAASGTALLHGGGPMLAWHALAVALGTVALRHGERLIHLFARLIRSALGAPSADPVLATRFPRIARPDAATCVHPGTPLLDAVHRRGPPVALTTF